MYQLKPLSECRTCLLSPRLQIQKFSWRKDVLQATISLEDDNSKSNFALGNIYVSKYISTWDSALPP